MARNAASALNGLQGRPVNLRHQLAYGGETWEAARWRLAAHGCFTSIPHSAA
jgi:hypothetical protein